MNFTSGVCVDIMGAKFKLIFVWSIQYRTQKWNKVMVPFSSSLKTHFFLVLESVVTLLQSLCEDPIHYLLRCLLETAVHMACVFGCLSALVAGSCSYVSNAHLCTAPLCVPACESQCGCGCRMDGRMHANICSLLFTACSIFCII